MQQHSTRIADRLQARTWQGRTGRELRSKEKKERKYISSNCGLGTSLILYRLLRMYIFSMLLTADFMLVVDDWMLRKRVKMSRILDEYI